MRYLFLVVAPHGDNQEVWQPYWLEADSLLDAQEKSKQIAFSIYEKSRYSLDRYRFELFKPDSVFPVTYGRDWIEEFLSQKT